MMELETRDIPIVYYKLGGCWSYALHFEMLYKNILKSAELAPDGED